MTVELEGTEAPGTATRRIWAREKAGGDAPQARHLRTDHLWPLGGFALVVLVIAWLGHATGDSVFGHSGYDSYTLEALAWRHGHVTVVNQPALELAIYHGHYYVSFPPLPAVVMFVLTFFFGANTPSGTVGLVYFFGGLIAVYLLVRRYRSADQATVWMLLVALGGSILSLAVAGHSTTGGVWFQAQLFAFFLTALAFLFMDGTSKRGWALAGACIALAVGCRPFNIVFAPVLLWMLFEHLGRNKRAMLPYLVPAVVVLAVFGAYNAARFGSPMEFGHTYLPELKQAGEPMFGSKHILHNIGHVLEAPKIKNGTLVFDNFGGFAVYLTNPMLFIALGVLIARGVTRKADIVDGILFVALIVLALMLLSHRTNGGYQYGTRYLLDLVPAEVYAIARGPLRIRTGGALLIGALITFNVIATVVFETTKY